MGSVRHIFINPTYELELGDLIDEVDVVEAFDGVEIALVDRIDAQEAGAALGARFAPLADVDLDRAGLVRAASMAPIGLRLSEVVEVAVRDPGEACIALIAEACVGALTELSGSGTREGAVEAVDLGQQQDILPSIAAREGSAGVPRRSLMRPLRWNWAISRLICARERPVTLHR